MVIQISPLNDSEAILLEKAKNLLKEPTYAKALKKALRIVIEDIESENSRFRSIMFAEKKKTRLNKCVKQS
jgi:hypothetical protein